MPSHRWRQRPVLATLLDVAIFLSPIAAATGVFWLLAPSTRSIPTGWRLALLLAVAAVVAFVVERVARRLLPLSTLLRLTMVFPDRAPSRYVVARQAGNPRQLLERLNSEVADEATAAQNILALVGALSAHDRKTRGHSERVRAYTDLLSAELGLEEHERDRLRWSALLHDIGKLRIDVGILNKPGKPTKVEWEALKAHPEQGRDLAAPLLPWLGVAGQAIVEHHERYDGKGYPFGISGKEISQGGRLIAMVDSFETMTAVRPYKKAVNHRQAREELARCAGSQFDPAIVRAFLSVSLPKVLWAMGPLSAALQLPYINTLQYAGSRALSVSGTAATAVSGPILAAGVAAVVATPGAVASPPAHAGVVGPSQAQAHRSPAGVTGAGGLGTVAASGVTRPADAVARAGARKKSPEASKRASSPVTRRSGSTPPSRRPAPVSTSGSKTPTPAATGAPDSSPAHPAHPAHPTKSPKPPKPAAGPMSSQSSGVALPVKPPELPTAPRHP